MDQSAEQMPNNSNPIPPQRKQHGCFYWGCMTLILMAVAGVIIGGSLFLYGRQKLKPACEAYLAAVEKDDYDAAYALIGPEWKKTQTRAEFAEFERDRNARLGKVEKKSMTGVSFETSEKLGTAGLAKYDAQFSKAKGTMRFSLLKHDGNWIVEGVNYDSPVLAKKSDRTTSGTDVESTTTANAPATSPSAVQELK